jgi:hypothetical protein
LEMGGCWRVQKSGLNVPASLETACLRRLREDNALPHRPEGVPASKASAGSRWTIPAFHRFVSDA